MVAISLNSIMIRNNIKIAIIGLGHIGKVQVAALQQTPGYELVAACDREGDLASLVPDGVAFYRSHQEMLMCGGFDTVIVATPNHTHNALAIEALVAGYNVIVEKPAAGSMEELDSLERAAHKARRYLNYAFHAAFAPEVLWLEEHLKRNEDKYGPLTAFFSRFYDPYIDENDELAPQAESLGDCWSDSGINALSVLHRIFPVDRLWVDSRRKSGKKGALPGLRSASVRYGFSISGMDKTGLGVIETAWDQGVNFKCTELYFAAKGFRLKVDHSQQSVTEYAPEGGNKNLVKFEGERLLNHYLGVFADYRKRYIEGTMNGEMGMYRIRLSGHKFFLSRPGD
ncbi:MAG: Gfo/Idh/MocA family protein, partial [Anaerolineae bacterium]